MIKFLTGDILVRLSAILLAVLLVVPFPGAAAGEDREKIAEVAVKGNRRIETAAILNAVKSKAGDFLYRDRVDADVRAIYKLGHFEDVAASTESGEKGLTLIFAVTEKPVVRDVRFTGNKELSTDKLRDGVEMKVNTIFSEKDLARSVRKLKKMYADEGYYLAEIQPTTEKRGTTEVRVSFNVNEGDKILIEEIKFHGNKAFKDRKLKRVMETDEAWLMSWLTGAGTYKEEVLKSDATLIADLYLNSGYINVKVSDPVVTVMSDKKGLLVEFLITEGDQFRVSSFDFKGDLLEPADELRKKLTMKPGEIFSRAALRTEVMNLTDFYADKGYAFVNVNPLTRVDNDKKTIDITFDMERGDKVTIDRITVSGNTKTRDKVVRREMKLAEGDLYSSSALRKSRQNLMNLGFFEEANIATARGSSPDKLNLNVDVKEKPTGTFSIGAGYSSLDGLIGQGSVQQANFLGLGLKANAAAALGGKSQTYNLGLTDPYFLDSKWTLGGDIYRTERDYLDYTRRATGGDIKAGYSLSDTISTFWIYKYEKKKIMDESQALRDSIRNGIIIAPETSSTTSSIYGSITRNTTDYRLDPSTGMVNSLSVEFAGLGGTNRFLRYLGDTTVFTPVVWSTVFSLRGRLGHIQGIGGKEVPIDEKFYLGGISSLRGYSGRTVSPYKTVIYPNNANQNQAVSNEVSRVYLGGTTEAILNAELNFPLIKEAGLKGVVFFDLGNAYDSDVFSRFQSSYGLGIRWSSPLGPLRLEYGIPINPREGIDKSSGRLEFSIGSFF